MHEAIDLLPVDFEVIALTIENLSLKMEKIRQVVDPLIKEHNTFNEKRETLFAQARQHLGSTADQTEWNFETRRFSKP